MSENSVPETPSLETRRQSIDRDYRQTSAEYYVPFRGSYITAPVITLSHDLLIYRADNGRLIAEMQEYLLGRGLEREAWQREQDSREVQVTLHELLLDKARDPQGPIYQELERQAQQIEPLLITVDGVVVNGNRRLAAMRELLHGDAQRYAGFAELRVAVLPADIEPADVEFVEAALQMAPETKLAYGWVNRRMKLKHQRDTLKLAPERICEAYRIDEPEQLDREIAQLALVEDYLENFREEPGHYGLVGDCEALFAGLQEQLAALPKELRGHWRLAGFTLIDGRQAVQGPMGSYFPFAAPVPEQIPSQALRRFAQERAMVVAEEEGNDTAGIDGSGWQEDVDLIFASPQHSARNAKLLYEVMEALRAEHHERRAPARALARVSKAKEMLGDLTPETLNDKQRRRLRADMAALQAQAAYLLGEGEAPARSDGVIDRLYRKLRA
ncbi:hypothetical protein [Aquibaculum arenosum]|uniref:Chromosome partitioning protein ParB n=1 Tax=Aquibaculum arenosum TaxID=3032591 RepID=A0ABT5YN79_9PROT|nr:hypothetical protein [Fodinicurvata sp. CAU 1616]MDF2096435.1 hypothetical protein [Fodinicurvata sp. CAU 1616]